MTRNIMDLINFVEGWKEWYIDRPDAVKKDSALRFGILGAAKIGPSALIIPARSHAEMIIAAVAARDKKKAEAYAKKWKIPIVHETYDDLINDPAIDCIYNPLPIGLHHEWTLKALAAGKHVLLEKPATSNSEEARHLFRHSILSSHSAPVLLEARHYQFHPAWHTFLSLFDPKDIEHAYADTALPGGLMPLDDIRFHYHLSGGTLMDLGTYNLSAIRGVFGTEPSSVTHATPRLPPHPHDQQCDIAMDASYIFPNGGTADLHTDLIARVRYTKGGSWLSWLFDGWGNWTAKGIPSVCGVTLREKYGTEDALNVATQKTVVLNKFMGPHAGHSIDINTTTTYRAQDGKVVKTEKSTESKKVYVWPEGKGVGEEWWPTYRYMLEAFVNRVKGREGSGAWVEGEESIKQMECIDRTYEKAGLAVRPTSKGLSEADRV